MDLSKFSDQDLDALEAGNLSKLSDAGLDELERQQSRAAATKPVATDAPTVGDYGKAAWDTVKDVGTMTKAGYAGVADLIAGNGLDKSVENIGHVKKGEDVTSGAAVFGEAFGDQFTPAQIAAQAAMGKIGEVVGPWVGSVLKGWAADAAVNAVGKIKTIAKALGIQNLDAVGKFLLAPIKIGSREFEPIVTATASPEKMLASAKAIQQAAGKELEAVAKTVNGAINGVTDASGMTMNVADTILDPAMLQKSIAALKEEAVGDLPNLGKAVAKQYDDAAKDLALFAEKQAEGKTATLFSDLAKIKTKIGGLVYKHGSPLESKAALNDVYHAVSDALDTAAKKVGGENGAAYDAANQIYHQVTAVVDALDGKVVDAKKWFDAPSFLAAMSAGFATHGPAAAVTVPAAYVGMKAAQNYGPQAIAAGLNASHPLVAKGIEVTAKGIPVVARAVADALTLHQADGE